jgi:ABC-2 type transport system permease protein
MFLPAFFVMVVAMVTALGASIKSSSRVGYAFGGIFYIISFTLSLLSAEITFAKDINLMSQMNTFQHALAGTWNMGYILTCLGIVGILAVLTIFFLYRTDYIESRTSYGQKIKGAAGVDLRSKLSNLRRPMEPFLSKLGWKYPAFRDQLQSSASSFLIYGFITAMLVFVVLLAYPGDAAMNALFTDMSTIIDNPLVAAFLFDHDVSASLEGFLIFKLMTFHWIYYGPFVFIATYSIIMRDKSDGYDEITWSMPHKRSRVIMQRTIAMLFYLWIIVALNWMAFWIGELTLSTFADVVAPDFISTIIAFSFLGLGYSLFLILFITLALIPKPKFLIITLVGAFMVAIFLPVIAFLNQDFSWISYLSPFKYFDVIGLLLNDVKIVEEAIPTILIGGVVAIILYLSSVMLLTPRKDIV